MINDETFFEIECDKCGERLMYHKMQMENNYLLGKVILTFECPPPEIWKAKSK